MKKWICTLLVAFALAAHADTPAPGKVKVLGGTDGTTIGNVGDALKTTASLSGSVSVSNFPVTQAVTGTFWQATQPVSGSLGRSWTLLNSTDSLTSYQGGSWSIAVNNFPSGFDANITNLSIPVTGTFWQATQPVSISGSVPVTGTFFQATQPISAVSLPLPSGAALNSTLTTINTTLGTPFQAGGSIGNTAFTANAGTNLNTSALNLETTQSAFKTANHTDLGTINTTLGTPFQAGGSIGNSSFGISGSLPAGTNSIGTVVQTALATGSVSNTSFDGTAVTITAPANAIGFILEAESGNTANIRYAVGTTASASVGTLMEPGRDTGYIPLAANISVIAISGTQNVDVQWVVR